MLFLSYQMLSVQNLGCAGMELRYGVDRYVRLVCWFCFKNVCCGGWVGVCVCLLVCCPVVWKTKALRNCRLLNRWLLSGSIWSGLGFPPARLLWELHFHHSEMTGEIWYRRKSMRMLKSFFSSFLLDSSLRRQRRPSPAEVLDDPHFQYNMIS